jgi:LmbE family N-acetylglucosaminyl deacetylase
MIGRLLGIWAHPDDEAYLSAGLMALVTSSGGHVAVRTATAGEHGSADPRRRGTRALAALRRRELRGSLAAVGVRDHLVAGLPDGGCADLPDEDGIELAGGWIDAARPDVVVTFGPDGFTGHPDHQAVSRWTTAAWEARGRTGRLLYATVTPAFHARWADVNERVGLWDGPAPCTAETDLALQVDCRPVLERKMAALRAHRSQTRPLLDAVGEATFREWWSIESFVAAEPVGAVHARPLRACAPT